MPAMLTCRCVVPIVTEKALNNMKSMNGKSAVDNFLLEIRMALKLRQLQYCDYIIPIAAGKQERPNPNAPVDFRKNIFTSSYGPWDSELRAFKNEYVSSIERKVKELLFGQGILPEGRPPRQRVRQTIIETISLQCPPFFVEEV